MSPSLRLMAAATFCSVSAATCTRCLRLQPHNVILEQVSHDAKHAKWRPPTSALPPPPPTLRRVHCTEDLVGMLTGWRARASAALYSTDVLRNHT